ncbi:hypothetical protein GCM10011375_32600 [Hymenobacter qilianensis]|uniref:Uncharacterized protein n=2 Tax=Hymenobacter qilianensis TaxID=1385715 RepID=A0ACB5PVA1_9BACT|nr:hypothetical protein [Hymenobacter qilianensis]QNP51457.1 hypothetical protein H9L05_15715 [Hymenobacter qilianensis]GGF74993.1 hypothetical protein GCM10011375_32600 [Hymenobacter qilianensis]
MTFTRQNILDTLGKGRYHSCVLTCYSFDFQFFELRVMRQLRAAGIQNILVLTDGPFLEYLASTASGREFQESIGFSIYPIYRTQGVFHPKVSLFFGAKEGLFAIGSGNLTASGMGNNDEAWGCFHVADSAAPNATLFADAWGYVQALTAPLQGMAAVKLTWIKQFTPWLTQLPKAEPGSWRPLDNGLKVALLTNGREGVLQQALVLIGQPVVKRLVTVSPYYDQAGVALSQLRASFPQARLQCVVEHRFGLLPKKLDPQVARGITFHKWKECGPSIADHVTRLHAKLVHFTTDQGEYLLLGSANVTAAGMGGNGVQPANEEASLLLHHLNGQYLVGLGINPTGENKMTLETLQKLKPPLGIEEEGSSSHFAKLPVGIVLAEIEQHTLTLHLAQEPADKYPVTVRLYSKQGFWQASEEPVHLVNPLRLVFPEVPDTVNMVELWDEAQAVVGRQFVQHPANQQQYCPDPNRQKLQLGFDALTDSGLEGFAEVLLDMVDLERSVALTKVGGNEASLKEDTTARVYEKLTPEEFNRQKQEELLQQQRLLNSPEVHISSFLNALSKRLLIGTAAEGYRESNEQGIDTDTDEGDQNTSIDVEEELRKLQAAQNGQRKKSIERFLDRLSKQQTQRLAAAAASEKPQAIRLTPLTLIDYAYFNIALHVAVKYIGNSYLLEKEGRQVKAYFLPDKGEIDDPKTFKGICSLIGNFLLQCTAGKEQYAEPLSEHESQLAEMRQNCFEMSLFLVLNAPWRANETGMRDILLANILHYLRPAGWLIQDLPKHLTKSFEHLLSQAKFGTAAGSVLLYQILPTLGARVQALQAALNLSAGERTFRSALQTQVGDWVFSSKLGICTVGNKYKGANNLAITLLHPGFLAQKEGARGTYRYELMPGTKLLVL